MEEKKKHAGGAPVKLNQELIVKLRNLLRAGAYVETAAASCGINKTTFYRWLEKGAKAKGGIYFELCNAVHKAVADAEMRDLITIDQASTGVEAEFLKNKDGELIYNHDGDPIVSKPAVKPDWKASAWRLERRNPKRWGARQTLEHVGADGGPIQSETRTIEEQKAEVKRLRAANDLAEKYK